jgi:hypothetical protein
MSTLKRTSASSRVTEQFRHGGLLHHAANLSCTTTKENGEEKTMTTFEFDSASIRDRAWLDYLWKGTR